MATSNSLFSRHTDLGLFILRVSVSVMLLLHGLAKLANGAAAIKGMLAAQGLPEFLAYGSLIGEVVAPIFIIIGFRTRCAAAIVAFNMAVAIAMAHAAHLFALDGMGGWAAELPGLYFFAALALMFTGAGRIAVSSKTLFD